MCRVLKERHEAACTVSLIKLTIISSTSEVFVQTDFRITIEQSGRSVEGRTVSHVLTHGTPQSVTFSNLFDVFADLSSS